MTGNETTGHPGKPGGTVPVAGRTPVGAAAPVPATTPVVWYPAACNNDPTCSEWPGAQLQGTPGAAPTAVTMTDIARFLPATAVLRSEPDGWAVVDVPANFVADADAVVVDGELLGKEAQVRFTPQRYRWQYGDGATRTTADPGGTWQALGQQELTTTPTSHVYRARGAVSVRVVVDYSAAYRVDGGDWTDVAGAVAGATPAVRVLVVTERTVLTAGDAPG